MYPTDWMPCPDVYAFTSRKKARKFALKKYGFEPRDIPGTDGVTMTLKNDQGHTVCLVIIESKNMDASNKIAVLAHECVHVAQVWAGNMGEDKPGVEWMAYAVQSTMLTCLKQLGDKWLESR